MIERHADIVILGGGPAGAAAAICLRQLAPDLRIVLLEKGAYRRPRIGETLPPGIRPLLRRLGLLERFLVRGHLPSYGTAASWGSPDLHHNEFIYQSAGRGWHLDRNAFDRMLVEGAEEAGVEVFLQSMAQDWTRDSEGWALKVSGPECPPWQLSARLVVDATGRQSAFARRNGVARRQIDRLTGVSMLFRVSDGSELPVGTLVEAVREGWWYSARLPNGTCLATFMTDSDQVRGLGLRERSSWLALLSRAVHTRARLEGWHPSGEVSVWPALLHRLERFCGPGWLATGDAAFTIDPLSSQGISKSIRSGMLAAFAAWDHLQGDETAFPKYEACLSGEFDGHLEARASFYREEQRWPESSFWKRRNITVPIIQPML